MTPFSSFYSLQNLTKLKKVTLSESGFPGGLTAILPKSVTEMHCFEANVPDNCFSNLPNLEILSFINTYVNDQLQKSLPLSLKHLSIKSTVLDDADDMPIDLYIVAPNDIEHLENLEYLELGQLEMSLLDVAKIPHKVKQLVISGEPAFTKESLRSVDEF